MAENKRVSLLIAILVLVVVVTGGVAMTLLYRTALSEQRDRLSETARSQARLIEAIAENEAAAAGGWSPKAAAAVLEQVQASHKNFQTAGQTTEITIARKQGSQILFLLRHQQHAVQAPQSLPMDTPLAVPMRLALSGNSGTTIAADYRGQPVLAAYEPVGTLGWGIVVKRDMTEIRAPFWRAGLLAALCSLGAVALGAFAFIGVTGPLLKHLRDSEDQLRRAVTYAPFPMMIHAEDGRVLLTSNAWNHLSGYQPHQLSTVSDWIERAYGAHTDAHRQRIARLYTTDGPVAEGERQVTTATGQKRIWDFSSAPLGETPEGTRLAISMAVDITERKQAEQALAAEKELLQVTLRSIGDAVITTDVHGNIATMNPVANTLTGWPLDEARGKPLAEVFRIINQYTRQRCENPVDKVMQTRGIIGLANHTALISRDGTERIIADSGAPIISTDGQIIGVVLVFRDNTAIDTVHQALRDSERIAQSTIDALSSHICVLDDKGTVLTVNRAWQGSIEAPPSAPQTHILGTNYLTICDAATGDGADEARAFAAGIRSVIDHKTDEFTLEYSCDDALGKRWFVGRVTRFEIDGATRVVVAHQDSTARKLAEDAMASAKEAAEAANQAKDRFLAALSHELRTPLTPVLATLSMLRDDLRVPAQLTDDVAMMLRHIELESRLIDDLLDLTRITRGQLQMQSQTVDAHELIDRALSVASQSVDTNILTIRHELAASQCHVHADPARLQQVFWNIIRNAMQYTADEGTLIIRTSNTADGEWEAQFIDSGIGIDREFLPHVFEAFERGNTGASRRPGGLGLGMAIARSIMRQLGGSIHAASDGRGKGSIFTIRLPVVSAQQPPAPRATPPAEPTRGLRILLVEDHVSTLKVLARLLKNHGHEVKAATCVQEAIAAGASDTFDLLLSDIGLPDGTGLDIMRWFSQNHPIRGIAFSGYGMDTDIQASREAGFVAHLIKPVVAQRLIQAIQHAVTV